MLPIVSSCWPDRADLGDHLALDRLAELLELFVIALTASAMPS